ncbi:hypothetical protein [Phyllobacterium sp. YR531]|uniref:hypothetical protein n=1 Tax=Phyllobacterium sp. YR531 TaxID=1144343 RepID=UPI00026FB246|nr:hypothetical protein [Phyllobacterium sp. YR531]EJN04224.1 hypothetical protein PMI41_01863 [Phyllobacterium sp. YR531]
MTVETTNEAGTLEAIAEAMAPKEPDILPIDHAEELMAVKMFYETRTIGLRAALRREQQKNAELLESNKQLQERVEAAEKNLDEVREDVAKLTPSKPGKAN